MKLRQIELAAGKPYRTSYSLNRDMSLLKRLPIPELEKDIKLVE